MLDRKIGDTPMKKSPNRLWLAVLFLGWLLDFLFWKHTPGISFAIYSLATLIGGYLLLRAEDVHPAVQTLYIVPLILFFSVMTAIRAEPMSSFLAYAFTLMLMILLAVTYRGGKWLNYSLADYVTRFFGLLGSLLARPLLFWGETHRASQEAPETDKRPSQFWPIVRGILFAIPILAFFAALLSSADMIFADRLDNFVKLLSLENLPEYIFRGIYIVAVGYALAGVYLHAANQSTDETLLGIEKPLLKPFFGFTEASVVLGSVVALFAIFVIIQFQYFFGGLANINIEGFTYSEYARRGFGELVAVAFFSLALFLGLSATVRRETERQSTIFSGLGLALLFLVGVMLFSAFQRLTLYEAAYGFTRLRAYTHVFIIWLAILLAASVALDLLQRQRAFALVAVLAALGFGASLLLMNVDGFIATQNIQRAQNGQKLDVGYLASLAPDAVPTMVKLYQSEKVDDSTRELIGASLACIKADETARGERSDTDFQAFHFSRYWSQLALDGVVNQLKAYKMDENVYPTTVTTPGGEKLDCVSYVFD
jgi:hypothetical protein